MRRSALLAVLLTATSAVAQDKPLQSYRTVLVEPFTADRKGEAATFPEDYEDILQKLLTERLATKQIFDDVLPKNDGNCERCTVLSAKVIHYGKGSRAARFWIGMGAGRQKVRVLFTLRDHATGNELLRFTAEGKHYGYADGQQASLLECLGDVIDRFIEKVTLAKAGKEGAA